MPKFGGSKRAFVLLRQVQSLARWRRAQGVVLDVRAEHQFAWVMAKILAGATPSFAERRRLNRLQDHDPRHGLDYCTLTRAVKDAGFSSLSEAELMTIIHDVLDWHDKHPRRPISHKAIGKHLGLTALERHDVKCWNILAVDESEQQREALKKERKRQADRQGARARRRHEGCMPRSEYLAQAESRRAFCAQHGITRQTLSKWIKAGKVRIVNGKVTSPSPRDIPLNSRATDLETPAEPRSAHGIGFWLRRLNETDTEFFDRSPLPGSDQAA